MAIRKDVYPTGMSGVETFGDEFCYPLNPDIINLSGRVEMDRIPLWEVPMDALPPVTLSFYEIPYTYAFNGQVYSAGSVFVGNFSTTKVFTSTNNDIVEDLIQVHNDSNGKLLTSFGKWQVSLGPGVFSDWNPCSVVANSSYVYACDSGRGYVHVFNHSGVFQFWFGLGGPGPGPGIPPGLRFAPTSMAIDSNYLYITDNTNGLSDDGHNVRVFDHSGNLVTTFGAGYGPVGKISIGNPGSGYFVGDWFALPGGTVPAYVYVNATSGSPGPITGIQIYPGSYTYRGDGYSISSVPIGPGGATVNIDSLHFQGGSGIAVNASRIYVIAKSGDNTPGNPGNIQIFNLSGTYQSTIGLLQNALGIAIDSSYIYVNEYIQPSNQGRIRKFDISTLVDSGTIIGPNQGTHKCEMSVGLYYPFPAQHMFAYNNHLYFPNNNSLQAGVEKIELPSGNFSRRFKWSSDWMFSPQAFCLTGSGAILIVDFSRDRIHETDLSGNVIDIWPSVNGIETGTPGSSYGPPATTGYIYSVTGIAQSSTRTFLSDSGNMLVSVYDNSGNYLFKFDGSLGAGGAFVYPSAIAVDSTRIYVLDAFGSPGWCGRVQIFDHNGVYITHFDGLDVPEGSFQAPYGIAVDSNYIYVVDTFNNVIQKFDLSGVYVSQFGGYGSADGQFDQPVKIDVSSSYIIVTDFNNGRIQVFDLSGTFITKQTVFGLLYGDVRYDPTSGIVYYIL